MRVLVVSHHALRDSGGVYDYNLCKHLSENGVDVHNIALFGNNSRYCSNARIAKTYFGFLPARISNIIGELFSPDIISELKKKYDIIHIQGAFWSFIPLQAVFWKKVLGIRTPMVMTTHTYNPKLQKMLGAALKDSIIQRNPSILFHALRCLPYRKLDKIFCQSDQESEFVIKQFKINAKKVVTIPNGVDPRRFKINSYDFKKRHDLKRHSMILYAGQLIKLKGISYLLHAIKLLKEMRMDCDLVLATYNPKDDVFSVAKSFGVQENVKICTGLKDEDLVSAYKSCDVFVLPSLQEGLPTVLLEAMAARKPIVSTNVGGVPFLIHDGVNGFTVNPCDPQALANKIALLLQNEIIYKEISENGYNTIMEKYRWDVIVKMIIEQYKEILTQ